jgi:hypothetical protein
LDDLCFLLAKLGYTARKTKGSHIIFQRGPSFFEPTTKQRRKSQDISSAPSAGRVAKIESQTMMKQ